MRSSGGTGSWFAFSALEEEGGKAHPRASHIREQVGSWELKDIAQSSEKDLSPQGTHSLVRGCD